MDLSSPQNLPSSDRIRISMESQLEGFLHGTLTTAENQTEFQTETYSTIEQERTMQRLRPPSYDPKVHTKNSQTEERTSTLSPSHSLNSSSDSETLSDFDDSTDDQRYRVKEDRKVAKGYRSCMKLRMKDGVTRLNVFSLLVGVFAINIQLALWNSFTVYLLDDNFGIVDDKAAKVLGNIGFVGDIASASTELILGTLMDVFGRKAISITGLLVAGLASLSSPFPRRLIGIYCLRCAANIGILPLLWSPYSIDYVYGESLGLYAGYGAIFMQVARMAASSGSIQIEKNIGLNAVYYIFGGMVLCMVVFLSFGLNDIK